MTVAVVYWILLGIFMAVVFAVMLLGVWSVRRRNFKSD